MVAKKKQKKEKKKVEKPFEGGVSKPQATPEKQRAAQPVPQATIPPPAFIRDALTEAKKKPEPKPEDDKVVADGAASDFWKILKGFLEARTKILKENTGEAITSQPMSMEQIGVKLLWKDLITDAYQDIIDFVENRAKIVEEIRREEQKKKGEGADEPSI